MPNGKTAKVPSMIRIEYPLIHYYFASRDALQFTASLMAEPIQLDRVYNNIMPGEDGIFFHMRTGSFG